MSTIVSTPQCPHTPFPTDTKRMLSHPMALFQNQMEHRIEHPPSKLSTKILFRNQINRFFIEREILLHLWKTSTATKHPLSLFSACLLRVPLSSFSSKWVKRKISFLLVFPTLTKSKSMTHVSISLRPTPQSTFSYQ